MNKLLLSVLLALNVQGVSIDHFKTELEAVKQRIEGLSYYEVETDYKIYDNRTGQVFESTSGLFVKNGKAYYNKVDVIETVHTPRYNIVIDNVSKYIAFDTVTGFNEQFSSVIMSIVDTMDFSRDVSISRLPVQGELKGFEIRFLKNNALNDKVLFQYNLKTMLPFKTVMYMRQQMQGKKADEMISPRFEMEFRNYKTTGNAKKHLAEIGNYLAKNEKGKWIIKHEKYKQYVLKKAF